MNEFDKLFNQYFGNDRNSYNDRMTKIINLMSRLNEGGLGGINPDEEKLGKPTTTRIFERDGVFFEESTWDTELGTIIRITTKEDIEFSEDYLNRNKIPLGTPAGKKVGKVKELSLEEQLKFAIKTEDYESAAKIRDLIEIKENKDKASENLDNKGFPEEDEWNF